MIFAERGISCVFGHRRGISIWPIETVSAFTTESQMSSQVGNYCLVAILSYVTVCANGINSCLELKIQRFVFAIPYL